MIARYGPCWGLTLWRLGRRKVELWYAPADYATPEHTHEDSDSEFTILWARNRYIYRKTHIAADNAIGRPNSTLGKADLSTCEKKALVSGPGDSYVAHTPGVWGVWLTVKAGTPHGFATGDSCMIFLTVQRWREGVKVTSVAEDFKLT